MTTAILIIAGIGLVAAVVLAVADKFLSVKEDPRIGMVTAALPGANCGGCGFAGCDGYARALHEFDTWLPELLAKLGDDDCVVITADHGCDPGYLKHTDHTREYIPMIALGKQVRPVNLGTRPGFCDIAATVAELLDVPYETPGRSFPHEIV